MVFFFSVVNVFIDTLHVFHPEVAVVLDCVANVPRDVDDRDLLPANLRSFFSVCLVEFLAKLVQLSVYDLQYLTLIFNTFI